MTTVAIPPLFGASATLTLVDERFLPLIGVRTSNAELIATRLEAPSLTDGWNVELVPTEEIYLVNQVQSFYHLDVVTRDRRQSFLFTVPVSAQSQPLGPLCEATAIPAGSTLVSRLLPASADDGNFAQWSEALQQWLPVGLLVYADNAAALAGGLTANTLYRTATGEVRIVV